MVLVGVVSESDEDMVMAESRRCYFLSDSRLEMAFIDSFSSSMEIFLTNLVLAASLREKLPGSVDIVRTPSFYLSRMAMRRSRPISLENFWMMESI